MLTQEDLQMLRAIIREEIEPIKQDLEEIKENAEITREAANYLLDIIEDKEKAIRKLM